MEKFTDTRVEGITKFSSNSTASYRYVLSLESDQVNIFLEDQSSKQQWQTGPLNKQDYITPANDLVDASAADYVSCFKECLDSRLGEDEDVERELVAQNGNKLKLELSWKIRFLHFARIHYTFELKPIVVQRIDILTLKLKAQQEELERLREKIDAGPTAFLYVESETLVDSKLQWKDVACEAFALGEDKTSIKILVSGIYSIGLLVNHTTPNNTREGLVSLQMNAKTIQSAASDSPFIRSCGCSWRRTNSSLMCVIRVAEGDDLSVVCSNMFVIEEMPSYLTIARLGA